MELSGFHSDSSTVSFLIFLPATNVRSMTSILPVSTENRMKRSTVSVVYQGVRIAQRIVDVMDPLPDSARAHATKGEALVAAAAFIVVPRHQEEKSHIGIGHGTSFKSFHRV